jgi:hypothetical protein
VVGVARKGKRKKQAASHHPINPCLFQRNSNASLHPLPFPRVLSLLALLQIQPIAERWMRLSNACHRPILRLALLTFCRSRGCVLFIPVWFDSCASYDLDFAIAHTRRTTLVVEKCLITIWSRNYGTTYNRSLPRATCYAAFAIR